MPLSTPAEREPIHTRHVTCNGFRRSDGLWDIEGHITDTKNYGFANHDRGEIPPGEPIHEMWIRITIDDAMTIRAVEAVTDYAPFASCDQIAGNYEKLVGLRIGPGMRREIRTRVGSEDGCTHISELMGPVATTAFQTLYPYLRQKQEEAAVNQVQKSGKDIANPAKNPLVGTCHGWRSDGPAVKRISPDQYTGE